MKKKFRISAKAFDSIKALTLIACFGICASASASVDLDRQYALETIGFLRATDNVDGLFADYVENAYKDYFSKQSRFVVQDLSKQDTALSHSKIPYATLIQDQQILAQVARTSHSQTILRTKVLKEGNQYRFLMEWLHAPSMIPLATTSLVLREPTDGLTMGISEVQAQIESGLEQLIKKVPWLGHITGRDNQSVTVNIGANANLHKGDTLVVGTLDDVKRHPLLHTIVDWKMTRTGTIEIDSVDEAIAFGHVSDEEQDRHILRLQKIMQIIPVSDESRFKVINEKNERANALQETPRLGYIKASLWPGGFSRQYTGAVDANSRTGGGTFLGAKLDGQLWFTREIFSELGFGYGFWSYNQQQPSTPSTNTLSGSSNVFTFKLDAGYSYLWTGDFMGPKAFGKLGYRSSSFSLPSSTSESIGPISFSSVFIGLGGDLPIRNQWGVDIDFDIGVLNSVSQTGSFTDGGTNSASSVSFSLGGYYRLNPRMTLRAALEVLAQSADFADNASVSQKIITFTPSLLYYF
jgi:hypothetical protein